MVTKAILFDLDGTLADTAPDLGVALNRLLNRRGLPEKDIDEIRSVASHGAAGLILLGTGISRDHPDYQRWRTDYLAEYETCFSEKTTLFFQINLLLTELSKRGLCWGIVTNKPKTFTDRLVPALGLAIPPEITVSGDTCSEAKPNPMPILYACSQIGVEAQDCLYVGDAERDIAAGRNAGMKTILAEWGYIAPSDEPKTWHADYSAKEPLDILKWI